MNTKTGKEEEYRGIVIITKQIKVEWLEQSLIGRLLEYKSMDSSWEDLMR